MLSRTKASQGSFTLLPVKQSDSKLAHKLHGWVVRPVIHQNPTSDLFTKPNLRFGRTVAGLPRGMSSQKHPYLWQKEQFRCPLSLPGGRNFVNGGRLQEIEHVTRVDVSFSPMSPESGLFSDAQRNIQRCVIGTEEQHLVRKYLPYTRYNSLVFLRSK